MGVEVSSQGLTFSEFWAPGQVRTVQLKEHGHA